jgi:hypothetical protein
MVTDGASMMGKTLIIFFSFTKHNTSQSRFGFHFLLVWIFNCGLGNVEYIHISNQSSSLQTRPHRQTG